MLRAESGTRAAVLLAAVAAAGIAVRFAGLGVRSFWCDELLAVSIGLHDPSWIVSFVTTKDAHPPLFYLLVRGMMRLGTGEAYLRLLPAVFGALCVPAAYAFGREIRDRRTGLILAALLAVNPAHILWSRLLKSYTLFTFLLLAAFVFFLRALRKGRPASFAFLFAADAALLYLHNFAFPVVVIQGFVLLFSGRLDRRWVLFYALLLAAYLPWLARIPDQLRFTLGVRRQIPTPVRYLYLWFYFILGETVSPFNLPVAVPAAAGAAVLLAAGAGAFPAAGRPERLLAAGGLAIPLLLVPLPSTVPQNLLPFSVFWLLVAAAGAARVRRIAPAAAVGLASAVSVVFLLAGTVSQYHDVSKLMPYREIGARLAAAAGPRDIIISTENRGFEGPAGRFSTFEWYCRPAAPVAVMTGPAFDGAACARLTAGRGRVWLFLNHNENAALNRLLLAWCVRRYRQFEERPYLWNERLMKRLTGGSGDRFYHFAEVRGFAADGGAR